MTNELYLLLLTAVSIAFFHTLMGPDHYLPFIVMSKARNWSRLKTLSITMLCGLGHVGSSVILGLIGIAFGLALTKLETFETYRGNLAAWFLIAFGLVYGVWGFRKALHDKHHNHLHLNINKDKVNITPWILFTIFVFGPCEPLIPLLMYPAAKENFMSIFWVSFIFGIVTIGTMLTIVALFSFGINRLPLRKLERYTHALAGTALFLCGLAIQFLGL